MSEYGKLIDGWHGVGHLVNEVTRLFDDSWINGTASFFASLPNAFFHHSTPTRISELDSDYQIPLPDIEYQATHSPTMEQFFDAANASYAIRGTAPEGLEPFEIDGRQAELVDLVSGMSARVWETTDNHQLIVSFAPSGGGLTLLTNPFQVPGQFISNVPTATGWESVGQQDAVKFVSYVADAANERGISSDDIFVTGHSLGGALAQYVGQQTGLGGVSWAGQGIVPSDNAVGDGSNFISVVTYGDPWATLSSDVEGVQPMAADFDVENGVHPHWGTVIPVGDVNDQVDLHDLYAAPLHDNALVFVVEFLARGFSHHFPANQGLDLGITPEIPRTDWFPGAKQHGELFDVADHTIAETIVANDERTDYHDLALPDTETDAQSLLAQAINANVSDDAVAQLDSSADLASVDSDVAAALAQVVGVAGADDAAQLDAVA
ncbi:hypothetical protein [Carnimonas bestiolae]|uniref:hypothetical protein n=1 Tax=Carnimonas bestiolae TaxID=3402172 RepID=UPI003EDC4C72